MGKYIKSLNNPLNIIGFFLVLVEAIASLVIINSSLTDSLNTILVLFIVIFPILVLIIFYELVTKHHKKLYAPKDYSDEDNFVKTFYNNENKQSGKIIINNKSSGIKIENSQSASYQMNEINTENVEILINKFDSAESLINTFKKLGYNCSKYTTLNDHSNTDDNDAIWLGAQIPLKSAKDVIKMSHEFYPALKYIHLSNDGGDIPPDEVHKQIFIGGSTSAAQRLGCMRWEDEDFINLQNANSISELHKLIRSKYY